MNLHCRVLVLSAFTFLILAIGCKPGAPSANQVVGKYVNKHRTTDTFELKSDGTFHIKQGMREIVGTYEVHGEALTIKTKGGSSETERIQSDGSIVDADGIIWVKN